jgi:hypothetical protein
MFLFVIHVFVIIDVFDQRSKGRREEGGGRKEDGRKAGGKEGRKDVNSFNRWEEYQHHNLLSGREFIFQKLSHFQ